jgi:hypothetical protein
MGWINSIPESIPFWGLVVSAIALGASVWFNRENSKHNKLMLFNNLVRGFFEIDRQVKEHKKSGSLKYWDAQLFNNIEYISYLANRDPFLQKHVIAYLGEAFICYKECILLKNHKEDYEDKNKYEEWKILSENIKNSGILKKTI